MRVFLSLLAGLLLLLAPLAAEARSTLVYKIPEGYVDVSPGAPAANFKGLAQAFVAETTSGKFELFAINRSAREAFEPRIFASTFPSDAPITPTNLDAYAEGLQKSIAAEGSTFTLLKKELAQVGGVRGGRLLYEKSEGGATRRILVYLVPDGDLTVNVFCMADASTFDKHLPAFEAAMGATTGAVPASNATLRRTALTAITGEGRVSTVPPAESPFSFSIPEGLIDVTAPGFDPALAEAARRANYAIYALGEAGETFNAVVVAGPLVLSEDQLDPMATGFEASFAKAGGKAKVTERALVKFGKTQAARLVFDMESEGIPLRGLLYIVPGGAHYARLTYLCTAPSFSRLIAAFEASAAATTGAASPSSSLVTGLLQSLALVVSGGAILLSLLGGVVYLVRRRNAARSLPHR